MRFLKNNLSLLLVATALLIWSGCAIDRTKSWGELKETQHFRDYAVRVFRDDESGEGGFEISRSGKRIYSRTGFQFEVGNVQDNNKTNHLIQMGRDITGDGQPNLVISEWTGGAHCCYIYYIFQIGDTFRVIDRINTEHGCGCGFKDLRGNGNLELATVDWTFAYWNTCFASSPAPEVILRYYNSRYRPDLELMHKPVPTEEELRLAAGDLKAKFTEETELGGYDRWRAPTDLWRQMLDLIYSGNRASAWKLLDLAWPADHPHKTEFLKDFKAHLAASPYSRAVNQRSFQEIGAVGSHE